MSELTENEILDTEPTHHAEHIVSPKSLHGDLRSADVFHCSHGCRVLC